MSFGGMFNYLIDNPVTTTGVDVITRTTEIGIGFMKKVFPPKAPPAPIIKMEPEPLWKLAYNNNNVFLRLAGLSGASAVLLGAYGAHTVLRDKTKDENLKVAFETANKYHFIHSLALLGTPLCRHSYISGSFFLMGLMLFCGSCYYTAITGDKRFTKVTPMGGTCFILGWLAMAI